MFDRELMLLVDLLFDGAREELEKNGYFLPAAMFRLTDRSTGAIRGVPQGKGGKEAEEIMVEIENGLRAQLLEKKLWFYAVCTRTSGPLPGGSKASDAIQVFLEHDDGQAMNIFMPYKKNWLGKFHYQEKITAPAESRIFKISSR